MNQFGIALLQLIQANPNQFSWYQLDRAIAIRGIERSGNLMDALHELETDGLIRSRKGANPSQPVYALTAKGANVLAGRIAS